VDQEVVGSFAVGGVGVAGPELKLKSLSESYVLIFLRYSLTTNISSYHRQDEERSLITDQQVTRIENNTAIDVKKVKSSETNPPRPGYRVKGRAIIL
jgi:hypothetical protein